MRPADPQLEDAPDDAGGFDGQLDRLGRPIQAGQHNAVDRVRNAESTAESGASGRSVHVDGAKVRQPDAFADG
ncbi:MAG: hypothetical protein R2911_43490 [Caldilineaceae bacterium]